MVVSGEAAEEALAKPEEDEVEESSAGSSMGLERMEELADLDGMSVGRSFYTSQFAHFLCSNF